jgi:hypothetical protein
MAQARSARDLDLDHGHEIVTSFASRVAASLESERFTLVDVGCAGGIEPVWRVFGERLRAVGFDASGAECRRLASEEKNPDIHYVAGFANVPPDHPFARQAEGKPDITRNTWPRTSAAHVTQMRRAGLRQASHAEQIYNNAWMLTEVADPGRPVVVPDVLRGKGFDDVDFLKIDIDGQDFWVLNSFDGQFDAFGVLAARMEVNLTGGPGDTVNTFNNTDRFMRRHDFELVALDRHTYSIAALPAPFAITVPAQTVSGRVIQGEAYYARDLASAEFAERAARTSTDKLLKLAAIFSVWQQPDSAAEILLRFRDRLAPRFDVDKALDELAAQSQAGVETPLDYKSYMALFESDPPEFYPRPSLPPPPPPPITFGRRLREAWLSFRDPNRRR